MAPGHESQPSASHSNAGLQTDPGRHHEPAGSEPGAPPEQSPSSAAGSALRTEGDSPLPPVELPPRARPPELRDSAEATPDPGAICADYGVPCPLGVTHWCGKRRFPGPDRQLFWDAFVSDQPPNELVDYYKGRLGERGLTPSETGATWRLAGNSSASGRTVEITTATPIPPQYSCEKPLPGAPRTLLVVTREQ